MIANYTYFRKLKNTSIYEGGQKNPRKYLMAKTITQKTKKKAKRRTTVGTKKGKELIPFCGKKLSHLLMSFA